MKNITEENKGIIHLGQKVMISDPCYGVGTWCQGVLDNVLEGKYECIVEYSDEGDWGVRVAVIQVIHEDYMDDISAYLAEDFKIGVDSGQAGVFDYEYYCKYHSNSTEREEVDDDWYNKVCDLTYCTIKNPNYEEFNWDIPNEDPSETWQRRKDYEKEKEKCWPYIQKLTGNTIDGLGFVSSTGFGDGEYICYTTRNEDEKIVAICIKFIK